MSYLTDPKQLRGLFGFLHNEEDGAAPRPYVSDSWDLLKKEVLHLGAHRVNGEEGTGRDLREVIQRIDSHELARTIAALNPVDLRTHTELGYDEGLDVGDRFARIVVWTHRNESVSLSKLLNEACEAAWSAGYTEAYGYTDDFVDGVYRGVTQSVETSAARLQTLDDALEEQSAKWPGVSASDLLAGTYNEEQLRSRKASYEWRQGNGTEELGIEDASPIQNLIEEVYELTANLSLDFPATGGEAAQAAKDLGEAGDVDGLRELGRLLLAEQDNPSDRDNIAALDSFLLKQQDEWREHEREIEDARELARKHNTDAKWIGSATEDPSITAQAPEEVERFDTDYELRAPLRSFGFITRWDANRRALLGDAIIQAVLEEGRTIVVSPALNDDVAGVYVTDEGWATEDES